MNKSATILKLAASVAKAQAEMPAVKMNSTNPFLKNKYADLGAVIEASRAILGKHGLAIVQTPVSEGDKIGVTTLLMHEQGEWLEDTIMLDIGEEKGKSRAQVAGSIITYLRRYSLSAILNLYADEDTDGHKPEQKQAQPAQKSDAEKIAAAIGRYISLQVEAAKAGIKDIPGVSNQMEYDQIVTAGKSLAERIKNHKEGK